jgi:hypothetical protein
VNPVIPRFFGRLLIFCVVALAAVFVADYLFLRMRMVSNFAGEPLGSVTTYPATTTKSGKLEIFYETPQTQVCAHSIFPHMGHMPCWYLSRSKISLISLGIAPTPSPRAYPFAPAQDFISPSSPKFPGPDSNFSRITQT